MGTGMLQKRHKKKTKTIKYHAVISHHQSINCYNNINIDMNNNDNLNIFTLNGNKYMNKL